VIVTNPPMHLDGKGNAAGGYIGEHMRRQGIQ
jgi:hypothetical protein